MHAAPRIALSVMLLVASPVVAIALDDASLPEEEKSWLSEWSGGVDFGLDGSTGNTDRTSLRVGANAQRETDRMITKARLSYRWSQENSEETANRLFTNLRNDWLLDDTPWRLFAEATWELDEFKDWDHRLSGFVGVGYELIKTDATFLLGRVGIGATQAFGGDDEDIYPEALLGLNFEHKITERQTFTASTELYPNLDETSEFRWNTLAAYQILVDPEVNLYLKAGIENWYDSDPGPDTKKNDFYYFVSLGWAF